MKIKTVPNGEVVGNRIKEVVYHVETYTPPIPPLDEIDGYGLPQREQKFRRTTLPSGFSPLAGRSGRDINDYATEYQEFIRREWQRRLTGYWFYNNGMVTYIPGGYYFELNYWHIDIGLKDYRDRDRRKWLFWQTQVDDPESFGCIYLKHRRDGATFMAGCINYEYASRNKNAYCGIQSKTGNDASAVFQKAIVKPFRKLPSFFIPIIANSDNPKKALEFSEPASKITKNNTKIKRSAALDSLIDFKPTIAEAYDGSKLHRVHLDEQGKNVECRFSELWKIVRECLSVGGGKKIVGKAIITSTVAEGTKKGGDEFRKIWELSDPTKLNANGRTVSGLKRLFIPASDGLEGFIDEYGLSKIEEARAFILNERKGLEDAGDFEGLAEHRRLYPLAETDAFTPPPKNCLFDVVKLDKRLDALQYNDAPYLQRGNFVWKNGERDTKVIWQPDKNGKWLTGYLFENDEQSNNVERRGAFCFPKNKDRFAGAADPTDHASDGSEHRSRFVATAFRKFDMLEPEGTTNKFVSLYSYRPPKPSLAYEDVLMMCVYYGMDMLPEMQKPGLANYMVERGYGAFVGKRPDHTYRADKKPKKKEMGINASVGMHEQIVEAWMTYVYDHSELIDFVDMITDLKEFDINDTRKYDIAMCGAYNLIYARKFKTKKSEENARKVSDYFKVHRA